MTQKIIAATVSGLMKLAQNKNTKWNIKKENTLRIWLEKLLLYYS